MTWNPNEYGGVESLSIPSTDIWIPDFFLINTADQSSWNQLGLARMKKNELLIL